MFWGMDIKQKIKDDVENAAREYMEENQCGHLFGLPLVAYAETINPLFLEFFERNMSSHPKEIYRPGETVVVHFTPFSQEVIQSNKEGNQISKEWILAYERSIMLAARINTVLLERFHEMGRLASLTGAVTDWDEEQARPKWVHQLAAFVAGMGQFELVGALRTEAGIAGKFGSIITELPIEPSKVWGEDGSPEEICDEIQRQWGYQGTQGVVLSPSTVGKCPAGAIFESGIDKQKCQEFCGKQGQILPVPDVCGKCFC